MIFTPDSLYALVGGYTFKRLGNKVLSDGVTPAEVVLAHPNGENVYFEFKDGEAWGRPNPSIHVKMDERLMMVDAEGWAVTSGPVYYDLYEGEGTKRRFLATDVTGCLGKLVSITDSRGVTVTPEDMGIDIIYGGDGVRQFLAPSRLADVTSLSNCQGFDVTIYPLQNMPDKSPVTGLYKLPDVRPSMRISVRPRDDGKRAVVMLRSGDAAPKSYIYDYLMGDWSMTKPSGGQDWKERQILDSKAAKIVEEVRSPANERLSRREMNFKWESWGFAMTNRVEGFDGVTDTTAWTYYTSGNGKGQVKTEKRQSGLLVQYAYDEADRIVSQTRSGPGMMTEKTTYSYASVDSSDAVPPVDTRPRTVVKTLNGTECERTYYVYSPLTNIVERVGVQGAAYGGANALRTVTAFYPIVEKDIRSGFVKSVRHEDGKVDEHDYVLSSNVWTETVTHLHELSPAPVNGKTTRSVTSTNARGEVIETRTDAFVEGAWHVVARERMTYNIEGKAIRRDDLAGQVTTTAWDCCHKISETGPDGSTTTWDYDIDGRMIATSRLIPLDMTNVTWLTTCYEYNGLGRQTANWQTNFAAQVGTPVTRTTYDALGRIHKRTDAFGNDTTNAYSSSGLTVSKFNPNASTVVTARNADGDIVSVTGTAVTPEFRTYGILPDGTRWTRTVQGETAESPRFTKRYENLLGQLVREERSGFQGAVIATAHDYDAYGRLVRTDADYEPTVEYAYDSFGERVATTRKVGGASTNVPNAQPVEWRKAENSLMYYFSDGTLWLVRTNIVSCSDLAIAPRVTFSSRKLTGLDVVHPYCVRKADARGNITEESITFSSSVVISTQEIPSAMNRMLTFFRYGVEVQEVSVSAVTNSYAYDVLGRQAGHTNGRGNTQKIEYNAFGLQSATIDPLGNRTSYAYDQFGNLAAVTNPLGNATVYEYDLRGRKTYEGGATYPVRYTYDVFGNKTTMMTYRNESLGPDSGDVTTWLYDEASGSMTNKVYADGKGPTYRYTPDGKLSRRVWARGVVTDYAYDCWGSLTNTVYSDDTPTVSVAFDVMGRQIEAHDAAGVTTFAYDAFGSVTNETVVGVAGTNTIERYWDAFGRTAGYALNGTRQTTIGYDPVTARIESMLTAGSTNEFRWTYLKGSDLKESLQYPNGDIVRWEYEVNRDLLTLVSNAEFSAYSYTYDSAGRRTSKNGEWYGYNERGELIMSTNDVVGVGCSYRYDDAGNRQWTSEFGTNTIYEVNCLNQYVKIFRAGIEEFPMFDSDGSQIDVRTGTGRWLIKYDGENRPVEWRCPADGQVVFMSYDRMGRRVCSGLETFIYLDYLSVENTIWDPTEPIASRALVYKVGASSSFYFHDGNKNVSDLVGKETFHYRYSPFGMSQQSTMTKDNPWLFSSERKDFKLDLVYYNYRYYIPLHGRWLTVDPLLEFGFSTLKQLDVHDASNMLGYTFIQNRPIDEYDVIGLKQVGGSIRCGNCIVCVDNDASSGDGNGYKIHWNCGRHRRPATCRGGSSAQWPSGAASHGSSGVPENIKKCLDKTRWRLESKSVSVPISEKCCETKDIVTAIPSNFGTLEGTPKTSPVSLCMGGVLMIVVIVALAPVGM